MHLNDTGHLNNHQDSTQFKFHIKNWIQSTDDIAPDSKAASGRIALPVLSLKGEMSNSLKIEATAIYIELSAKYLPGHNLSQCIFNKQNAFQIILFFLPPAISKSGIRIFHSWSKEAFGVEFVSVCAIRCFIMQQFPVRWHESSIRNDVIDDWFTKYFPVQESPQVWNILWRHRPEWHGVENQKVWQDAIVKPLYTEHWCKVASLCLRILEADCIPPLCRASPGPFAGLRDKEPWQEKIYEAHLLSEGDRDASLDPNKRETRKHMPCLYPQRIEWIQRPVWSSLAREIHFLCCRVLAIATTWKKVLQFQIPRQP